MINYVVGDATNPIGDGNKIITHVSNNLGGWEKGFVLSLSKKWPQPENTYRKMHKKYGLILGEVQAVRVESDIIVINMIAQKGYGKNNQDLHKTNNENSEIPLQIEALEKCMQKVYELAISTKSSIHAPRFGCGLAGSSWDKIEPLIQKHWKALNVYIYDLKT